MSFLPKFWGEIGIFQRVMSGGEVTFQSAWGGRVLVRNLNFQISAWGGSLIFDNLQCFQAFQTWKFQNFLQPWWIKAKIPIYICSGIIIWCLQIWMKIDEKVACGEGSHFWKCWGRNRFGEELKILDFAWGGNWPWMTLCFLAQNPLVSLLNISAYVIGLKQLSMTNWLQI